MKIVVVLNKYGEQQNLNVTGIFYKEDEVLESFGVPTYEFVQWYEDNMDTVVPNNFYFDHIFFVDTDKLTPKKYSRNYYKSDPLNKYKMYCYGKCI